MNLGPFTAEQWFQLIVIVSSVMVGIAAGLRYYLRGMDAATEMVANQFDLLSHRDAPRVAREMPTPEAQSAWRQMEPKIRAQTGGVVRLGHLYWVLDRVEKGEPLHPIPNFEPPADAKYRLQADRGFPVMVAFVLARQNGGSGLEELRAIHTAAQAGSPIAMTQYGAAKINGLIPGEAPDPVEGRRWLERAVAACPECGADSTLGRLLLEGIKIPADRDAGLALLEQAARRGNESAAVAVGAAFLYGEHGCSPDPKRAERAVLQVAPRWRQRLAAAGFSQRRWCRHVVDEFRSLRQEAQEMIADGRARRRSRL